MSMSSKYNFIYSKLVSSEDDVIGLIAYGIYKKHKIEFITKIKEEQHREPTEEECGSFFASSTTESQLNNYRIQAETMLSEMVGNIANEELRRYEDDMLRNYKREITSCLNEMTSKFPSNAKTFGLSIAAGFVSAFLFAVIAGLFYFIGETSDRSAHDRVEKMIEKALDVPSDSILNHP